MNIYLRLLWLQNLTPLIFGLENETIGEYYQAENQTITTIYTHYHSELVSSDEQKTILVNKTKRLLTLQCQGIFIVKTTSAIL